MNDERNDDWGPTILKSVVLFPFALLLLICSAVASIYDEVDYSLRRGKHRHPVK